MRSSHQAVLPNLDALRFLAFLAVMLAHVYNASMEHTNDAGLYSFYLFMKYGVWGVNFFFVLSGFLITRLLLNDVITYGKPKLLRFYKRRVLRIWPLYVVVLIGAALHYMIFNVEDTNTHWWYFILFAGNFHILFEGYPYSSSLSSLWTIAVEEQFYLLSPLLVFLFHKRIAWVALLILIISVAFRFWVVTEKSISDKHIYFNTFSVMNDLAIGMLMAALTQRLAANSIRLNGLVQIAIAVGLICLVWMFERMDNKIISAPFDRVVLALFFAFVVFQQVFVSNRGFNLQSVPGINYLGKISYGLYMYHMFALQVVYFLFERFNVSLAALNGLVVFPIAVLVVTFFIAATSYELFEKKILRLKYIWAA